MARNRASFIVQVVLMSVLTLLSRMLGFIRELFFVRIIGARALSDAFLTALRVPSMVYEICIGGACGPAILPTMVLVARTRNMQLISSCVTALMLSMGVSMMLSAALLGVYAEEVLRTLAPGFSAEQVAYAVVLLPILALFMVTSALAAALGEILRALRYPSVPAAGQLIVNGVFLAGLCLYALNKGALSLLAWSVVVGGCVQVAVYASVAWHVGVRLTFPQAEAWQYVRTMLVRMVPCMITAGIQELALFVELQFASYLPPGSVSLLTYASSFVRLPFGIFVHAAVTALLPDLAQVQQYAPRRVPFLIAETLMAVGWVIIPVSLLLWWFSYDIFATLYWSPAFPLEKVLVASRLLAIKAPSLILLTVNHILVQLLYVRQKTFLPTLVSLLSISSNALINLLCVRSYGIFGIALAGVSTVALRTLLFIVLAAAQGSLRVYLVRVLRCWGRTVLQTALCCGPALGIISFARAALRTSTYAWYADSIALWGLVGVVCSAAALVMFFTRRRFGIRLYLLDHRS